MSAGGRAGGRAGSVIELAKEELRKQRNEELDQFELRDLVWFGAVPMWTDDVVDRMGKAEPWFRAAFERAKGAGLFQHLPGTANPDDVVSPSGAFVVREDLASTLRQRIDGMDALRSELDRIGGRLRELAAVELPELLARWTTLFCDATRDTEAAGTRLGERVRNLVEGDQLGEALDWVETAEHAAALLGGRLLADARLGRQMLELGVRRRYDADRLRHSYFLERPAQTEAILDSYRSTTEWAIHLHGVGGVGKSMLIRHLVCNVAKQLGAPVARIDFDYLSPKFPASDPGALIEALANELRLQQRTHDQSYSHAKLDDGFTRLRNVVRAAPRPDDPVASLRRAEASEMIELFADLVRGMRRSHGAPTILVLDTCEELAKVDAIPGRAPAVEAAFDILERVQKQSQGNIRVVFAGRRYVARGGAGWAVPPERDVPGLPGARPYLRRLELVAFERGEATTYLQQRFARTRPNIATDPDAVKALLDASRDAETAPVERFNPFDLDLYAGWFETVTDAALDKLCTPGRDPYIEERMIARLGSLRLFLCPVLLMGAFDRSMLASLGTVDEVERAWQELRASEWVDVRRDERGELAVVPERLIARVCRYLNAKDRTELPAARRRLAHALAEQVQSTDADKLSPLLVDAALRLAEPSDAVALWIEVFERLVDAGSPDLVSLGSRMFHEGAAATSNEWLARVIQASSWLASGDPGTTPIGTLLKATRGLDPDSRSQRRFSDRLWLASVTFEGKLDGDDHARAIALGALLGDIIATIAPDDRASLASDATRALARLVDVQEIFAPVTIVPAALLASEPPATGAMAAWWRVLVARARCVVGDDGFLSDAQAAATSCLDEVDATEFRDTLDQARAELLRLATLNRESSLVSSETVWMWITSAGTRLPRLAADNVCSAGLAWRRARRPVTAVELASWPEPQRSGPSPEPWQTYLRVRPYASVLARARIAAHVTADGVAVEALLDSMDLLDLEAAIVRATRNRSRAKELLSSSILSFTRSPVFYQILQAAAIAGGQSPDPWLAQAEAQFKELWWQSRAFDDLASARNALELLASGDVLEGMITISRGSMRFLIGSVGLEANRVAALVGSDAQHRDALCLRPWLPTRTARLSPSHPHYAWYVQYRFIQFALSGEPVADLSAPSCWLAAAALKLGEDLALRLPGAARSLLDLAGSLAHDVDPWCELQAHCAAAFAAHRCGLTAEVETRVAGIRAHYDALQQVEPDELAPWNEAVERRPAEVAGQSSFDAWLDLLARVTGPHHPLREDDRFVLGSSALGALEVGLKPGRPPMSGSPRAAADAPQRSVPPSGTLRVRVDERGTMVALDRGETVQVGLREPQAYYQAVSLPPDWTAAHVVILDIARPLVDRAWEAVVRLGGLPDADIVRTSGRTLPELAIPYLGSVRRCSHAGESLPWKAQNAGVAIGRAVRTTVGSALALDGMQLVPRAIWQALASHAVVILQGEPRDITSRGSTELIDVPVLREMGASIIDCGAKAVVVLPSTPWPLATDLANRLSRDLGSEVTPAALFAAVRTARQIIGSSAAPDDLERALDVTLFVASDQNLQRSV